MKVVEIYKSVQGEGLLSGTESVFLRTSGCNLRCWFCDTPYTSWSPEGEELPVTEMVDRITSFDCGHIVLTGGEPLLHAEMVPLCEALHRTDRHITVETAGTLYLPLTCDLMSISPKFSSSAPPTTNESNWHLRHEETRHVPNVIRQLIREHVYQIKFVIHSLQDCEAAEDYLRELVEIDRQRVLMMPQGTDRKQLAQVTDWLEPYCEQNQLIFCPRHQIEWFGMVRGT